MSSRLVTLEDVHATKAQVDDGPARESSHKPPERKPAEKEMKKTLAVGTQLVHYLNGFRRLTLLFIGALMALVVLLTAAQLMWTMVTDVFIPPRLFLSLVNLFKILGTFALVLIAVELFETTLKAYAADVNHAELMIRVAIIAAARHAILTDYESASLQAMLGLAAVVIALTAGAYFMKRASYPTSGHGRPAEMS